MPGSNVETSGGISIFNDNDNNTISVVTNPSANNSQTEYQTIDMNSRSSKTGALYNWTEKIFSDPELLAEYENIVGYKPNQQIKEENPYDKNEFNGEVWKGVQALPEKPEDILVDATTQIFENGEPNILTVSKLFGRYAFEQEEENIKLDAFIQRTLAAEDAWDRSHFKDHNKKLLIEDFSYNGLHDPINFTDPIVVLDPTESLMSQIRVTVPDDSAWTGNNPETGESHITENWTMRRKQGVDWPLITICGTPLKKEQIRSFELDYTGFYPTLHLEIIDNPNNRLLSHILVGNALTNFISVVIVPAPIANTPYRKLSMKFNRLTTQEWNETYNGKVEKMIGIDGIYYCPGLYDKMNAAIVYEPIANVSHLNKLIANLEDEDAPENQIKTVYIDAFNKIKNDGTWRWRDSGNIILPESMEYITAGLTYIHDLPNGSYELVYVHETQNYVRYEEAFDECEEKAYQKWLKAIKETKKIPAKKDRKGNVIKWKNVEVYPRIEQNKTIEDFRKENNYVELCKAEYPTYVKEQENLRTWGYANPTPKQKQTMTEKQPKPKVGDKKTENGVEYEYKKVGRRYKWVKVKK